MDRELDEIISASTFRVRQGRFAVVNAATVPNPTRCLMVSHDEDEITVIVDQDNLDQVEVLERAKDDYRLIELTVGFPFRSTGLLAAETSALAERGVNILVVAAFSKDYLLVRDAQLDLAITALVERGFRHVGA